MITFDSTQVTSDNYFVSFTVEWNEFSDSVTTGIASGIASDLFSLENNQSTYGDIYGLIGDWTTEIVGAPAFGWTIDTPDSFSLGQNPGYTTIGHDPGVYGVDIDRWDTNGGGNVELTYRIGIPLLQFEYDDVAGYNSSSDARLEVPSDIFPSSFLVGTVKKGSFTYDLSTTSNDIPQVVVPESNHFSIVFSLIVFGLTLTRRVRLG